MRYFIQIVTGGTDPEIHGEYETDEEREIAMESLYRDGEVGDEDGVFYLDIDEKGTPKFYTVSSQKYYKWIGLDED